MSDTVSGPLFLHKSLGPRWPCKVASRRMHGAATLTRRTGRREIDTQFANFSRSVSPWETLSGGPVARPSPHSRTAGRNSTSRRRNLASSTILRIRRGGIGSDQRLDLVAGENSAERWLRIGKVSAKSPTLRLRSGQAFSRRTRELWHPAAALRNGNRSVLTHIFDRSSTTVLLPEKL